ERASKVVRGRGRRRAIGGGGATSGAHAEYLGEAAHGARNRGSGAGRWGRYGVHVLEHPQEASREASHGEAQASHARVETSHEGARAVVRSPRSWSSARGRPKASVSSILVKVGLKDATAAASGQNGGVGAGHCRQLAQTDTTASVGALFVLGKTIGL